MAIKEVGIVTKVGTLGVGVGVAVGVVAVGVAAATVLYLYKNPDTIKKISDCIFKTNNSQEKSEPESYNLLLIVPADKLLSGIVIDSPLTKDEISKLLQNTKHAYCFSANDKDKESVVDNIKLSNDKIDNTTSINVLVHIELKAYPGIEKEKANFDVKRKIPDNSDAIVKKINILSNINSVSDFYEPL